MKDVNEACDLFLQELDALLDYSVPKSTVKLSTYPVWYTAQIVKDIKLKRRLWKRLKKKGFNRDLTRVNSLRKRIRTEVNNAYRNFINTAENDIKTNPRNLWTYINLKKNCTSVPGIRSLRKKELTSPQQIVDSFAEFFSSVFIRDSDCDNMNLRDNACDSLKISDTICDMPTLHNFVINRQRISVGLRHDYRWGRAGSPGLSSG
ncbi:hypothetical protein Zmor_017675 [Zophobas morio]|uniref:Uncharacterized protein n=1 Tax=Zophobas morio TaxID=2755281 RepID=A0AA38MCE6_9CUCU|nr:hypothetical protein Zmor_017675 [Zophobas morio]